MPALHKNQMVDQFVRVQLQVLTNQVIPVVSVEFGRGTVQTNQDIFGWSPAGAKGWFRR